MRGRPPAGGRSASEPGRRCERLRIARRRIGGRRGLYRRASLAASRQRLPPGCCPGAAPGPHSRSAPLRVAASISPLLLSICEANWLVQEVCSYESTDANTPVLVFRRNPHTPVAHSPSPQCSYLGGRSLYLEKKEYLLFNSKCVSTFFGRTQARPQGSQTLRSPLNEGAADTGCQMIVDGGQDAFDLLRIQSAKLRVQELRDPRLHRSGIGQRLRSAGLGKRCGGQGSKMHRPRIPHHGAPGHLVPGAGTLSVAPQDPHIALPMAVVPACGLGMPHVLEQ